MLKSTQLKLAAIIILIFIALLGLCSKLFWNSLVGQTIAAPSTCMKESIDAGIFLESRSAIPEQLIYRNKSIKFEEVWIENMSRISYKWMFFKYKRPVKGFRLCFYVSKESDIDFISGPSFFTNSNYQSIGLLLTRFPGGNNIWSLEIPKDVPDTLQIVYESSRHNYSETVCFIRNSN